MTDSAARPPRRRPAGRRRLQAASAVASLLLVGVGAGVLAGYQWDRVVAYSTPYAFDLEPGEQTPPIVDRVVIVVVDGLRLDAARDLPTFRELGAQGSFLVARTAEPSLSFPGWTTLTTGSPPEISGVTTNRHEGPVRIDSLFDAASRAGVRTGVAGGAGWRQLYGDIVDAMVTVDDEEVAESDERIGEAALRLLEEEDPGLLLVHLPDTDHRAHETGVGRRYRSAAREADRIIARVVEAAGEETALVLTADHGHIDAGGHGGTEEAVRRVPLVLAGEGLVPGARGEVAQKDVAPTVAALLGIARPSHATGELRPVLLDASEEERAEIAAAHEAVAARFYDRATGVVGGSGDSAAAFERAREERLRHDILARLPIALGVIALAALAVVLGSQGIDLLAILAGTSTFFAGWAGLFFGRGLTFSFSHLNTEDQVQSFLVARLADVVVASILAAAIAGIVAGRRRRDGWFAAGVGTVAWAMLLIGFGAAVFLTLFGWGVTWRLPPLSAGFGHFLALIALVGLGATAWLAGLAAHGAGRLTASRRR